MSVRLTWTNNSSGHDGTYIYRSTATMDPQALPAPIADIAAGSEEYIDPGASQQIAYYYRVQDHESGQVSTVSDEVVIDLTPDYASAQIGDEIGGGIYAGTLTYDDAREFHIIASKQDAEVYGVAWATQNDVTGAQDLYDGKDNTDTVLSFYSGDPSIAEAHNHAATLEVESFDDWYLPARYELQLIYDNLVTASHPEFTTALSDLRWSSVENPDNADNGAGAFKFSDGSWGINFAKGSTAPYRSRPVRRVAA